jgi:hypothetical protein
MTVRTLACTITRASAPAAPAGGVDEITITTPTADYLRDTIDPLGANLARYLAGPRAVHLFHDHARWPVARTESLVRTAAGIRARFRWLEGLPDAEIARRLFTQGVLGASIEFLPDAPPVPNERGGWAITQWTLTGWAFTADPANPECVKALSGRGRRAGEIADAELRAVLPGVLRELVQDHVQRALARHTGALEADAEAIDLDAIERDDLVALDGTDLRAALQDVLSEAAAGAVRRLTGRVD